LAHELEHASHLQAELTRLDKEGVRGPAAVETLKRMFDGRMGTSPGGARFHQMTEHKALEAEERVGLTMRRPLEYLLTDSLGTLIERGERKIEIPAELNPYPEMEAVYYLDRQAGNEDLITEYFRLAVKKYVAIIRSAFPEAGAEPSEPTARNFLYTYVAYHNLMSFGSVRSRVANKLLWPMIEDYIRGLSQGRI